jgi:hypothetical protein
MIAGRSHLSDATAPIWRVDVDALAFLPEGHGGLCMVHRRAFRTLLKREPKPADCESFFGAHRAAFEAAAQAKILRAPVGAGANFHLNSRDLRRELAN